MSLSEDKKAPRDEMSGRCLMGRRLPRLKTLMKVSCVDTTDTGVYAPHDDARERVSSPSCISRFEFSRQGGGNLGLRNRKKETRERNGHQTGFI